MALLHYFKKINTNNLPDPNDSLSTPKEIASANKLVKETEATQGEEHCEYNKFSPEMRAAIREYASHHGPTKTARHLLKTSVNVRSIHMAYVLKVSRKRKLEDCPTISILPTKKRGRWLLFRER